MKGAVSSAGFFHRRCFRLLAISVTERVHLKDTAPLAQISCRYASTKANEMIEQKVAKMSDLPDGQMKEVEIRSQKILLVNQRGKISAVGGKCTHYGAPLVKGAFSNGTVRCPWHGACFNVSSGDIEDFPGLDSLPVYQVDVQGEDIVLRISEEDLSIDKRLKPMCKQETNDQTFLLVGGGPASLVCAETLRQEGFKGRIVIATKENHPPYDRPKLSKALHLNADQLYLRSEKFLQDHDIELLMGKEAVEVNTAKKTVRFVDNVQIRYNKLLLATGGRPRCLDIPGVQLKNVFYLRSPEDAKSIDSFAEGKDIVVIGTSFIGLEVAAYLADKANSVSVIGDGTQKVPFHPVFGLRIGAAIQKMHEEKNVKFYMHHGVEELRGENGKLTSIVLKTGDVLKADACIPGVGMLPATEFLKDSGLQLDGRGAVTVDKFLKAQEDIYAAGDIASFPSYLHGNQHVNIGHWQIAQSHGRCVALNMLGRNIAFRSVPYFWTVQFGKSIRYTGHALSYDDILYDGKVEDGKFAAYFLKGDKVVASASLMMDPKVSEVAQLMAEKGTPSVSDLKTELRMSSL